MRSYLTALTALAALLALALVACGASTTEPEPEPTCETHPDEVYGCHAFDNDVVIEDLFPLDSMAADSLS